MELDAFRARLGLSQGRIRPAAGTPVSGEHVFVLGEEEPGRFHNLAVVVMTAGAADVMRTLQLAAIRAFGVSRAFQ